MFELNKLYNMDCMEGMKQIPDKYFELAIVDPPYGIGIGHKANTAVTIVGGERDHSAVRVKAAGGNCKRHPNFITPLMIARHQRENTLQS